jgi:inosine/xanthosine triphosphatase
MKIHVGSKNSVKIDAVKETITEYPMFRDAEVFSFDVSSGVSDQPKSIEEIIKGAKNRALACFKDCDFSFGHESGIAKIPETKTGFMNIDVCAIYDGDKYHLGVSPCFEYPIKVMKHVIEDNDDINQAFSKVGLTDKKALGSEEGAIGLLTKGRMPRKEFTKHSIRMAIIHLENPDLY